MTNPALNVLVFILFSMVSQLLIAFKMEIIGFMIDKQTSDR